MGTNTEQQHQDERRPLLSPPQQRTGKPTAVFYLLLCVVFLFHIGITAPVVPSTAILDDALCWRRGDLLPGHGCVDDTSSVQSRIAVLQGVMSFTALILGE